MGSQRAYSDVVRERLVHWFLFGRTFHMEISQLLEMFKALEKPVRLGRNWGYVKGKYQKIPNLKREQVHTLFSQLEEMAKAK